MKFGNFVFLEIFEQQLEVFTRESESARRLIAVGESEPDPTCDPAELAAWSTVTSMILNLDETITKS